MVEITWTFAVLEAFAIALSSAIEGETRFFGVVLHDRLFLYLRGILMSGAFIASQLITTVPDSVIVSVGAVTVFLGVLGYWPQVQNIAARAQGVER